MAARSALHSENPPRKLAKARFRPSRREGEVVVGHSPLRFRVDAPHACSRCLARPELVLQIQFPRDGTCDRFGIRFHILVTRTNDLPAHGFQMPLPFQIVLHDVVVIATINLDNQHLMRARKVHDPWLNRMLTSKLQTA